MWKIWYPCAILVSAKLCSCCGNNVQIPQKTKTRTITWPSNPAWPTNPAIRLGIYPEESESQTDNCTPMFTET